MAARLERRVLATLAADVVGYARLTEADETGTTARLRAVRAETVDPLIAWHRGRLVRLTGGRAVVTLESVVHAVRCAVEIQRTLAVRNARLPRGERLLLRIGVSLGAVALVDDDLCGDGVSVAAGLERLCDPGGVMVSGAAYDRLHGKLDLALDSAGERTVENVEQPVRAYRVRLDQVRRRRMPGTTRLARLAAAAMVILLMAIVTGWWLRPKAGPGLGPDVAARQSGR